MYSVFCPVWICYSEGLLLFSVIGKVTVKHSTLTLFANVIRIHDSAPDPNRSWAKLILNRAVPDLFLAGLLPDLEWQIRPEPELEPDFQIDCNFTNLMCKNIIQTYSDLSFWLFFVQQLLLHHLHALMQ